MTLMVPTRAPQRFSDRSHFLSICFIGKARGVRIAGAGAYTGARAKLSAGPPERG